MGEDWINLRIKRRIFEDERFMHEFMKLYSKIDDLQDSTNRVIDSPQVSSTDDRRVSPQKVAQVVGHTEGSSGDIHSQNKRLLDKDYVKTNESVGGRHE